MDNEIELANEQKFVDTAYAERERKRKFRVNPGVRPLEALAYPVNTWGGGLEPDIRLNELGRVDDEVTFGYIQEESGEQFYLGTNLIYDIEQNLLVSSWAAPIASKYYKSGLGSPLGLARKCRLVHGKPNLLRDLEITIFKDLAIRVASLASGVKELEIADISDSVLDELEADSTGSLKEIIRTIHASQYEIISARRKGLHVVQGAPGTGKTVVGVHRVSWLLYPGNDEALKPEKTLVVGPNNTFIQYISGLLPALGEEKIAQRSIQNIGNNFKVVGTDNPQAERIKADPRMKMLLNQGLRDRLRIPKSVLTHTTANKSRLVEITSKEIEEKIAELRQENHSYNSDRQAFKTYVLNKFNEILSSESPTKTRNATFVTESEIESTVEKIWPSLTVQAFLRDLFRSQPRLISAAKYLDFSIQEVLILERKPARALAQEPWTKSDVALLDYLDFLFHGTPETFDFIVVDEAQDLTPMQLDSIARRTSEKGDILLLGDMAQATGVWSYENWESLASELGTKITRLDELKYGYRVPKQIFEYAVKVLSYIDSSLTPPILIRSVKEAPMLETYKDIGGLTSSLLSQLERLSKESGVTGIIGTPKMCNLLALRLNQNEIVFSRAKSGGIHPGINLISTDEHKGLECDHVIVIDPQGIIDNSEAGIRQLYVACTRALKTMVILALGTMPFQLTEQSPMKDVEMSVSKSSPAANREMDTKSIYRDITGYLTVRGISFSQLVEIFKGFSK